MKLEKDGIVKDIEDFLVADYICAGWNEYKEKKIQEDKPKKEIKKEVENKGE